MNQALISMTTRYHYAPKGERISADMEKKSCNYSYIGAIDYLGLIDFMIFKGSVKQEDFFGFLSDRTYILQNKKLCSKKKSQM